MSNWSKNEEDFHPLMDELYHKAVGGGIEMRPSYLLLGSPWQPPWQGRIFFKKYLMLRVLSWSVVAIKAIIYSCSIIYRVFLSHMHLIGKL